MQSMQPSRRRAAGPGVARVMLRRKSEQVDYWRVNTAGANHANAALATGNVGLPVDSVLAQELPYECRLLRVTLTSDDAWHLRQLSI